MPSLTQKRKDEIAAELKVAATWVGGPRQVKLLALSEEISGLDPEEANQAALEAAAKLSSPTLKATPEELEAGKKAEEALAKAQAKAAK